MFDNRNLVQMTLIVGKQSINILVKIVLVLLLLGIANAQSVVEIPKEFGQKALDHVKVLTSYGEREPGTEAEKKTINYISKQFQNLGYEVEIDSFYYSGVKLKNREISIEGKNIQIRTLFINEVYHDSMIIRGIGHIIDDAEKEIHDGDKNTIFLSTRSNYAIKLQLYNPAGIIIVDEEILRELKKYDHKYIELEISSTKKFEFKKSYNVVAYKPSVEGISKNIILTAHWDSENGPGADDNASGVASLIELSNYFYHENEKLGYNIIFVATGAEEKGLIGSKAFVQKHIDVVNNCILNINIDGVGGGSKPYIEMKHPLKFTNVDTSSYLEYISIDNLNSTFLTSFLEVYWNSSSPEIYPEWLQNDIKQTMKKLQYRYSKASCCSGADHRTFAYLGIPVMYVDIISRKEKKIHHTEKDLINESFVTNLNKTGKIVVNIIHSVNEYLYAP